MSATTGPSGTTTVVADCTPGASFMGCASTGTPSTALTASPPPAGCKFPDVSSYQGHPDWAQVKAWQLAAHCPAGGVFKMGEYTTDPDAAYDAGQLHALGMIAIGYWFARNTGCAHESAQIIAAARVFLLKVVVIDAEVPEARGYVACLSAPIRAAGLVPVEYTGPGTNPDSSNPGLDEWVAAYGPSHPPCVFVCSVGEPPRQTIVAWQYTDGRYGFPTYVPGVGTDDVSIDYGLLALAAPPAPKPDPYAIFPLAKVTLFGQKVSERLTVERWFSAKCVNPVRREVCRSTRTHLAWLAGRLATLAEHAAIRNAPAQPTRRYDWAPNHWGARHYRIERILHSKPRSHR